MFKNTSNTLQAFWVGIGSFSSFAIALLSAAILSRYLNKAEYGTYRQILYVYNSLLVVFTAGLPRVFSYFLPRYGLGQGKEIVFKISKVLFFTGMAFSIFLFSFSGIIAAILKNPELAVGLKYFSPVPVLLLPTLGIEGIFSTYRQTYYSALYNVLSRVFMLLFIVVPVMIFRKSYLTAVYGWLVASFIMLIMAYIFKNIPFRNVKLEKSGLGFTEILKYSLPLVSASIAGIIYRSANQFYISRYYGPEVFAEFSNGFIEIPFVNMITGATATVLMPLFSKIIHEKSDISQLTNMWQSALRKSAVLIYPMVIFFLFYSKEVVSIVYSSSYAVSAKYFSTAMILNFFNIIVFTPLLLSLGESRYYARIHYALALITWLTGYIMIITFNTPISIAVSFVIIGICGIFFSLVYVSRKISVPFFELFPFIKLLVIAIHSFLSLLPVSLFIKHFMPDVGNLLKVTLAATGYLIILLVSSKLIKVNYFEIIKPLLKKKK